MAPDPKDSGMIVDDVRESVVASMKEVEAAVETPPAEAAPAPAPVETPKTDDRPRGPDGKFAKKEDAAAAEKAPDETPAAPAKPEAASKPAEAASKAQDAAVSPQAAAPAGPPASWSIAAKSQWDALAKQFPALAAEIHKRETDVSEGFKQYEGLRPFADMAAQSGKRLPDVLNTYVSTERAIRADPVRAFAHIARANLGLTEHEAGQLFSQIAAAFGAGAVGHGPLAPGIPSATDSSFGANAPPQHQFDPNAISQVIKPFEDRFGRLEQTIQQLTAGQIAAQSRSVESVIDRFRSDPAHRYFDNLEGSIAKLFESGIVERTGDHAADLAKAYEIASWQHPEIRAELIKQQAQKAADDRAAQERSNAEKARAAAKSISGPAMPGPVANGSFGSGDDVEADVRRAVSAHRM